MLQQLQAIGQLRRERDPDPALLGELFRNFLPRLRCAVCRQTPLVIRSRSKNDWPEGRACAGCRQRISAERLEALPQTELCAACAVANPARTAEREFCPRCGEVMTWRVSSAGIARYVMHCPRCRT